MANKFCVSITHAKDNTDKATVGFVVANAAAGSGKETLVFLSIEAVRNWAEREIRKSVGGNLILAGDEEIALEGAFHGGPGILIIAGTGSNVLGRAVDGAMYQAGGWGPALGDEGSGFWSTLRDI